MIDIGGIVKAVREVVGDRGGVLHAPQVTAKDARAVADTMGGDPVGYGAVMAFENALAMHCRRKHVLAVSSGTAGLHLALLAVGVKPGDLVVMPSLTFVAAANAVSYCGATPFLVDSNPHTMGVDTASIWSGPQIPHGRRVGAVLGVHLLGYPADMAALAALAGRMGAPLVEDAAEALGTADGNLPAGAYGAVSVVSFNANKIVTTGGGGAVMTNDPELHERMRYWACTAKLPSKHFYEHGAVGYNYRMPNINAAWGKPQLARLTQTIQTKRRLTAAYCRALAPLGVDVRQPGDDWNCWLNHVRLPDTTTRNALLKALDAAGIANRAIFTPMHMLDPYCSCQRQGELWVADKLFSQIVCLPSGPGVFA